MTFVVIRQGIDIQGVFGPYPSAETAAAAARDEASRDVDNYHQWQVQPLTPNGLGETVVAFKYDGPPRSGYWNSTRDQRRFAPGPVRQMP